jgi:hypothetical protein
VSSWKSSISASREGSRESAEELGIDRRQSLKLQLLSMFLDDAEFRQSVQVPTLYSLCGVCVCGVCSVCGVG